ncbi:hypothetical protein SOVF_204160 [Spinacia oleracea]|nr:hypothetical protein SOVF_204160 [Spinacia oleracea]
MVRVSSSLVIKALIMYSLLLMSMHDQEIFCVEAYAIPSDARKGVPATGIPNGGRQKFVMGKIGRRVLQDDQDYDYYDFYRKHEDIPSPGIGH